MTRNNHKNKATSTASNSATAPASMKEDDKHPFIVVSHRKKPSGTPAGAHTTARSSVENTATPVSSKHSYASKVVDKTALPMRSPVRTRSSTQSTGILVTISSFGAFHYRIFPVIQQIISTIKTSQDPFLETWRKITTQSSNKVTESSSFRTVSKALGLNDNDLLAYRRFIESCPLIGNYVTIEDGTVPNGFMYYLKSGPSRTGKSPHSLESDSVASRQSLFSVDNSSVVLNSQKSHENIKKIVTDKISTATETKPDSNTGDNISASDEEITDPTSLIHMDDDEATCSTLKTTLEDGFDSSTAINDPAVQSNVAYATCYNNNGDFTLMMLKFWPAILHFITEQPHHEHSKQWNLWMGAGLHPETDLAQVKQITGLHTLDQIYLFLRDSPALQQKFDIIWDHKINYRQRGMLETPTRDNTYRQTNEDTSYVDFDHIPASFKPFHQLVFNLINKQCNMEAFQQDTWDSWIHDGLRAETDWRDIYNILHITSISAYIGLMCQFPIFATTFTITWATDKGGFYYAYKQPTFSLHQKYLSTGRNNNLQLPTLSTAQHSTQGIDVQLLATRLTKLEERFSTFDTLRHYTQASEIQSSVKSLIYEELQSLDVALKRKSTQFQAQMHKTIDTLLKEVYAAANDGHAAMMATHDEMLKEHKNLIAEIQAIDEGHQESVKLINEFMPYIPELNTIKDKLVQFLEMKEQPKWPHNLGSVDQGSGSADHQSVRSQPPLSSTNAHWAAGPPKPIASRWVNFRARMQTPPDPPHGNGLRDQHIQAPLYNNPVDQDQNVPAPQHHSPVDHRPSSSGNYRPPDTVTAKHTPSTHHGHGHSTAFPEPPIGKIGTAPISNSGHNVPHTVHVNSAGEHHDLPPVNHDAAIKRAKIQYTGIGDFFVFYHQLLNGMAQFGIYLSHLDNVRYQESVCPAEYNGITITPHRYQLMASTLYQKLQNPEVIPHEHTAIRHIINRYAEQNDGYKVLYAMLELIHPVLHQDAVLLPPKSTECNEDIHLYAQKFDSWLKYEAYANRPYTARETVNLFLRELSSHFAPAISRIRRLMDTWNQYDANVPEPLRLSSLPVTIERYMNEETNTPYVRRIHHPQSPRKSGRSSGTPEDKGKDPRHDKTKDLRPSKDHMCRLCGGYGHDDEHCDFTAKLLNVQDTAKKVDARLKEKLKDQYKLEQQKRRNRKLRKKVGVIRQMLDDGIHPDEVDDALAALPGLMDDQDNMSDTDSASSGMDNGEDHQA